MQTAFKALTARCFVKAFVTGNLRLEEAKGLAERTEAALTTLGAQPMFPSQVYTIHSLYCNIFLSSLAHHY